jgi:hypothetical protein
MSINTPAPRPPQPQPSARLVAAAVTEQIRQAIRRSQLIGAAHAATWCPRGGPGGGCVPCQAEARRSWAAYRERERVEVARQHAESMARLARRPVSPRVARDAALAEATRRIGGAGARCVVCRVDHADGSRSCRACGAETTDAYLVPFLDTLNGRARADRPPEDGSSAGAGGAGRRPDVRGARA